nr:YbjQ family protein [Metabacillus crassostreae]
MKVIIVTTETVPGKVTKEYKGFVRGSTVQSKHIGKDIMAGLKTIVGGELKEYTEMMEEARQKAIGRMVDDAKAKGANAIVCMRLESSAVMQNASEIIAYGTAVTIEE